MSYRIQQRVVQDFELWAAARGRLDKDVKCWRDRISILLEARADYLGKPDRTLWRSGDVHELFIQFAAPRQVDAWQLADHAVATFGDYLRFLDESEWLHPSSTRVTTLLKELNRLAPTFHEAMADTSRFRLAKRVYSAMLADGVPFGADADVVDAWVERFNARDEAGRQEVLGELVDEHPEYVVARMMAHEGLVVLVAPDAATCKHQVFGTAQCDCGWQDDPEQVPTVRLPDDETLARRIADGRSDLLRQLRDLATWVGEQGRPVNRQAELSKSDVAAAAAAVGLPAVEPQRIDEVPALYQLWQLALEFDMVSLRRTRVIQGEGLPTLESALRGDGDASGVLGLWGDAYDELVSSSSPARDTDSHRVRVWVERWTPWFLTMLYEAAPGGEFVEFAPLLAELVESRPGMVPTREPELFEALIGPAVLIVLNQLARHGAVEIDLPPVAADVPEQVAESLALAGMAPWALTPPDGLRVRFTILGQYAVRERLLAEGVVEVPAVEPVPAVG